MTHRASYESCLDLVRKHRLDQTGDGAGADLKLDLRVGGRVGTKDGRQAHGCGCRTGAQGWQLEDLVERVRCIRKPVRLTLVSPTRTPALWWDALECGVEDILLAPLSVSRIFEYLHISPSW